MSMKSDCDYCMHNYFDEENDEYSCQVTLDEDDYGRYISNRHERCPYFRMGNDYSIVKKQV